MPVSSDRPIFFASGNCPKQKGGAGWQKPPIWQPNIGGISTSPANLHLLIGFDELMFKSP